MKVVQRFFRILAAGALLGLLCALPVRAETVLVTDSNQGIGLEFAKQFAARGWTVIATHRRSETPDTLAELQKQYPDTVKPERMDVTKKDEIAALAERLKGQPIDIILNNAALIRFADIRDREGNKGQLFGTLDYDHMDQFMHTNVAGPLMIAEEFRDNLIASQRKMIVTISSAAGMVTIAPRSADHYWYRITKAALNSAMRLLAVELADEGVTVVMFHPGGVQVESFGDNKMPGMVPPEEAIGKMMQTIDGLTIKDSGRFLQNDGKDQPW
ncbi:MAG: SDR family oxidoreductase [Gammaproteobacteria bacterium]|nr:MAG: SDR family oxidoreductase [Gammaproteobacteria bacterium]